MSKKYKVFVTFNDNEPVVVVCDSDVRLHTESSYEYVSEIAVVDCIYRKMLSVTPRTDYLMVQGEAARMVWHCNERRVSCSDEDYMRRCAFMSFRGENESLVCVLTHGDVPHHANNVRLLGIEERHMIESIEDIVHAYSTTRHPYEMCSGAWRKLACTISWMMQDMYQTFEFSLNPASLNKAVATLMY